MLVLSDFIYKEDLSLVEKLVYMIIYSYYTENKTCTTKEIARGANASLRTTQTTLKSLKEKGLIKVNKMDIYEIKEILENKKMKDIGIGNKTCEWCKCNTYILHSHHFPIRKENGGLETVDICPNCHHEFHFLENNITIIDKGYLKDK